MMPHLCSHFRILRLTTLLALTGSLLSAQDLRISEIHTAGYPGENEVFTDNDWIEIRNTGSTPINLQGYGLTDGVERSNFWLFPDLTLEAGAYLVLLANGEDAFDPFTGLYQLNFRLDNDGEYVGLVGPDGATLDAIDPGFPAQIYGHSYGRPAGSADFAFLESPTPEAGNQVEGYLGKTSAPEFSEPRGFKEAEFSLEIFSPDPGSTLHYSLDGSHPLGPEGLDYNGSLEVGETTIVRAAASRPGYLDSEIVTRSFIFADSVFSQPEDPEGFPSTWGSGESQQVADYGMDSRVLQNRRWKDEITDALPAIPSVSVVMDPDELFGADGLWGNADERGRAWERAISIEFISDEPGLDFQVGAGMRMSGGAARNNSNPKHPFRVYFRGEYGPGKLEAPIFANDTFDGENAADSFDVLLFRAVQNFSWIQSSNWFSSQAIYFRDLWVADAQLAMGHVSTHGRPVHVFLNGLYWGVYILQEQIDDSFASDYWGGADDDWDVVKHYIPDGEINADIYEVKDGNGDAWDLAQDLADLDMSVPSNYDQLAAKIDIDNHIDYMMLNIYAANSDGVVIRETEGNNWYGARLREPGEGFRFINWDAEFALVSPQEDKSDMHGTNNPATYYAAFRDNPEWRLRFADRIQKQMLGDGPLSREKNVERFLYRKAQFELPILLEAARWGDYAGSRRDRVDWDRAVNKVLNEFFPVRNNFVLNLFKEDQLYPSVGAPVFKPETSRADFGTPVELSPPTGETGTLYYTLDGSDPRLAGGGISPSASAYAASEPLLIDQSLSIKTRLFSGGNWSALVEKSYVLNQDYGNLVVSEMHYNPLDFNGTDGEAFEFIELGNLGLEPLDLTGIYFSDGIEFTFPSGTSLSPGEVLVLVPDPAQFRLIHPTVTITGQYEGQLRNSGERVALSIAGGTEILAFEYSDDAPWPETADGDGPSLEATLSSRRNDPGNPASWQPGKEAGGTPGTVVEPAWMRPPWAQLTLEAGNVYQDPDYGIFELVSGPWVYHGRLGWLYYSPASDAGAIWFFSPDESWIYAPRDAGGWLYFHRTASWSR